MNNILVVSSNTENLITLSHLLTRKGYCVIAKGDGSSARSVIAEGIPVDLVIADYALPDMNVNAFFSLLKSATAVPPPVILLSDRVNVMDYLNALSLGVFEFLFRPIHPPEFLRIVNVAIRRNALNYDQPGRHQQAYIPGTRFKEDSKTSASL